MVVYVLKNKELTVRARPAFDDENRGGVADAEDKEGHDVQNRISRPRNIGPSGLSTILLDHGNWMWIPPNVSFKKAVLGNLIDDANLELVKIKGVMGMLFRNQDDTSDIAAEHAIDAVPENLDVRQSEVMKRSPLGTLPNLDQESYVGPNRAQKEISALSKYGQPACIFTSTPKYLFPKGESSNSRKFSELKRLGSTFKREIENSTDEYRRNPHHSHRAEYSHRAELPHRSSRSQKSSEIISREKRFHSTHERDREPLHPRYRSRSPSSRRAGCPHCPCNRKSRGNFAPERRLKSRRDRDIPSRKDFPHARNLNQQSVSIDRDERRVGFYGGVARRLRYEAPSAEQPNPPGTGSARTKRRRRMRQNAIDLSRILAAGEAWARANPIGSDKGM